MGSFGNSRPSGKSLRLGAPVAALMLGFCLGFMLGCGGGGSGPQQVAENSSKPSAKPDRGTTDPAEKSPTRKKKDDDIPYDAFFDNPLEVVASNAAVVAPAAGKTNDPADTPKTNTTAAASGGATAWSDVLPMENLQGEIKKLQNHLKASMQSPGTYNGTYKDIAVDGAVIAALAGIAIEHSGEVSWKANAPMIRDVGLELSKAAAGLGKENYEKTKTAYEKLDSIFAGSIPTDVKNAAPKRPFDEVASREGLMKRIEKGRNHLRDNINIEAKLKSEADGVLHETLLISTLAKIVSLEGYSSADEEDYQKYAKTLIDGAHEASAAAKDQSFQKFTDSMNKVNKSCDQCHANYANG